jgi:GxxExxY protein
MHVVGANDADISTPSPIVRGMPPSSPHAPIAHTVNQTSGIVVDAAMTVHTAFGPGLLESAYLRCLVLELRSRGVRVDMEVPITIDYAGVNIGGAYRIDLLVDGEVIVEVKAVAQLLPIHQAQVMTYLRLSKRRVALLINFNVVHLKDGITRFVV